MRTMLAICAVVLAFSILASDANAAQVMLLLRREKEADGTFSYVREENELALSVEADLVTERELDKSDVKATGSFYGVKLFFSPLGIQETDFRDHRFDMYVGLGTAPQMEYEGTVGGDKIKFDLKDQIFWTIGLAYTRSGLSPKGAFLPFQLGVSAQYRQMASSDDDSDVSGSAIAPAQGETKMSWSEWQIAVVIAKEYERFTPYGGIKYSDVSANAKVVTPGATYDLGSMGAKNNFGIFAGTSIKLRKNISVEVEGRFLDEQAFTIGMTYKF